MSFIYRKVKERILYYFGHLREKCPANSEKETIFSLLYRKMQEFLTKKYERIKFSRPK